MWTLLRLETEAKGVIKILIYFVIGAVLGVVVGLLIAPFEHPRYIEKLVQDREYYKRKIIILQTQKEETEKIIDNMTRQIEYMHKTAAIDRKAGKTKMTVPNPYLEPKAESNRDIDEPNENTTEEREINE